MRSRTPLLSVLLTTLCAAALSADATGPLAPEGPVHPSRRPAAAPAGGLAAPVNPPPLLWPAQSLGSGSKRADYSVRLSQRPDFPAGETVRADNLPWAMFNPHRPLGQGRWYWQYAVVRPGGQADWSDRFEFQVDAHSRVQATPTAEEMIAAWPKTHPRILIDRKSLEARRRQWKNSPEAAVLVRAARGLIGGKLPDPKEGKPAEKGANEHQARSFARWASKAYGARLTEPVTRLVRAYLITGDPKYGREAARRALFIAALDPDGVTSPRVSDFSNGRCMQAMALAYDSCFDLFSPREKQRLRDALAVRAGRFYKSAVNGLETRAFSAHIWQHILIEFTEAAVAGLGEIEGADEWLRYVYELWIARFPLLGGEDGGWANGVNYFGTNFDTLLDLPELFHRATGADLIDHPWYRNTIYYQLYAWPPGSSSDGFGDGGEREGPPPASRGFFLEALGEKFHDPYALWYADQVLRAAGAGDNPPGSVLWRRLTRGLQAAPSPPASLPPLPQARLFRDIGVVSMHTRLMDASKDLMIGFRSSPYGSDNHMHACQNSFNILYGGKRVFANSGYYIAYGDDHFLGWYKHTRGHNSILIDGKGQTFGTEGYGWIPRFLHGRQVTYCVGDASNAYGDAGLVAFRRHLLFLRPSVIVIYDDLKADHPARWSWLLHCKDKMTVQGPGVRLRARTETASAQSDLFGAVPLAVTVDDRFDPPAVNWRKRTSGGRVIQYPNQWHATASPKEPRKANRVLALILIHGAADSSGFDNPKLGSDGSLRIGSWRIRAELDASQPPALSAVQDQGTAAFAALAGAVVLDGKRYQADQPGASLLVETAEGQPLVRQCVDQLPAAARRP